MPLLRVDNVGAAGFLPDVEYWQLNQNAWTFLQDVKLGENSLIPTDLLKEFQSEAGQDTSSIFLSAITHTVGTIVWLVLCTRERVYVTRGNTLVDITPPGFLFNSNLSERWQFTSFNGFLIVNDRSSEPHYWPITSVEAGVPKLIPLSEYPGSSPWEKGQICRFIVGFNSALFAGYITNAAGIFPYLILFSDFAEPGTLPQAWEPRPENSAGRRDLAEGQDEIITALPFKDILVVRKKDSVIVFTFTGGQFVYQRRTAADEISILNNNCVCNTPSFQFVIADNDIYISEGSQHRSVVKNKVKNWFFRNLNRAEVDKVFCFHNSLQTEIWILAPHGDSEFCNVALIWNYLEDTYTTRTCKNYLHGVEVSGILPDGFEAWQDLTGTWG